jgi:hypothetical protein
MINIFNKLNGWQRLWVLIALIYALLITSITAEFFPTQSKIKQEWSAIKAAREPSSDFMRNNPFSDLPLAEGKRDKDFAARLDNLYMEQTKHILAGFFKWLIPMLGIYIFGYLAGWVYRGFKK